MGFSEALSVEFLKVDYQSASFARAIRSCFTENIHFSCLKYINSNENFVAEMFAKIS